MIDELGVKTIIDCSGNVTVLGGNFVDEVIEAMKEAASSFFDMQELHRKAGESVAELIDAEDAFIVGGAEAGLVLSLAACMTRGDIGKMAELPSTRGMKDKMIVQSLHRNMYDYNLRFTGAKIAEVGTRNGTSARDLESAITETTAATVYFVFDPQTGVLPLEEVSRICHGHGIPVIADGAGELPPKENLTQFLRSGADLAVFSGGKGIGAPNDTGVIVGRKNLLDCCRKLGPHSYLPYESGTHVFIGRPMKSSKEDDFAFVTALKKYLSIDHEARLTKWEKRAEFIIRKLSEYGEVANVAKIYDGYDQPRPACVPKVEVALLTRKTSAERMMHDLRHCETPIAAYVLEDKLYLSPQCLKVGEERIVTEKVSQLLKAIRGM